MQAKYLVWHTKRRRFLFFWPRVVTIGRYQTPAKALNARDRHNRANPNEPAKVTLLPDTHPTKIGGWWFGKGGFFRW